MLPFLTAALVIIVSYLVVKLLLKKQKQSKQVPGLKASDPVLGNLPDLVKAGSFLDFLAQLHEKYGPIASFWYKDVFTVSLADQKLFRHTERMFDRHPAMFEFVLPLLSPASLQYQNGENGRDLYRQFSQAFNHSSCKLLLESVKSAAVGRVDNWDVSKPLALHKEMMELAVVLISSTQFGGYFKQAEHVEQFFDGYQVVFQDMDDALLGSWAFGQGDEREKIFEKNLADFKETIRKVVHFHKQRKDSGEYDLAPFLDIVLDNVDDEEEIVSQAITFMIGGFHTTGMYLSWLLYYITLYPYVQEKMRKEIMEHVGSEGIKSMEDIDKLKYVTQVMDETLRLAKIASFSVRKAEKDLEIDGLLVKQGTMILNSISVTMNDEALFPDHESFNPDRFNPENKKVRGLANSPFGFGVRKCPGYRFSNMEVILIVVDVLTKYQINLANPEEERIKPIYGFVAKPEREIWVKLTNLSL